MRGSESSTVTVAATLHMASLGSFGSISSAATYLGHDFVQMEDDCLVTPDDCRRLLTKCCICDDVRLLG